MSKFLYIADAHLTTKNTVEVEIAYQLRRIADILESKMNGGPM